MCHSPWGRKESDTTQRLKSSNERAQSPERAGSRKTLTVSKWEQAPSGGRVEDSTEGAARAAGSIPSLAEDGEESGGLWRPQDQGVNCGGARSGRIRVHVEDQTIRICRSVDSHACQPHVRGEREIK